MRQQNTTISLLAQEYPEGFTVPVTVSNNSSQGDESIRPSWDVCWLRTALALCGDGEVRRRHSGSQQISGTDQALGSERWGEAWGRAKGCERPQSQQKSYSEIHFLYSVHILLRSLLLICHSGVREAFLFSSDREHFYGTLLRSEKNWDQEIRIFKPEFLDFFFYRYVLKPVGSPCYVKKNGIWKIRK